MEVRFLHGTRPDQDLNQGQSQGQTEGIACIQKEITAVMMELKSKAVVMLAVMIVHDLVTTGYHHESINSRQNTAVVVVVINEGNVEEVTKFLVFL